MDRVNTYGTTATAANATGGTAVEVVPAARRISWGAVFGGVVLGLALNLLLSLLGIGIGLTTVDPAQVGGSPAASSLGIGAAIWWVLSMLAAMFVGGYAAARLAGVFQRGDGILHGLVTWAFLLLLTFYLLTSAIGGLVGGAFSTLAGGVRGATGAAQQAAEGSGITGGQVAQQADRLVAQIAPNATPDQVAQARRELAGIAPQFLRGGEQAAQARQQATDILARTAGVPAEQIRAQVDQALQQAETQARQTAETAANAASSAAIWGFVALALGAAAAAAGGATGTRRVGIAPPAS
ncbi:hypothetical protein HHL28_01995 [Aerophototrophica crusticola]|uniref:PhnA-like protein n=1 Tax=Aerophototrophica crusticola TaxID=1709002 RepID=A0A858R3T3_9PROT|nr:hypothetical protein HHL28_01995 [Rhodospirillaceae bacterium B3]